MAKKKLLLNESVTRRFMKLATIKPSYVSNFITEAEEDEELMEAPMDEPMDEPAPEGEEDAALEAEPAMDDELEVEDELDDPVDDATAGDAETLVMDLLAKIQEFAKENGVAMELEGDDEDEEDDGMDAEMDMEMDDAEPEGGEEPEEADMDMGLDADAGAEDELTLQEGRADEEATSVSLINEEAIVAEVTKRVARRLLKESAK